MIIYYDILLIDDESLLGVQHSERYERLKSLIVTRSGYAELIDRQTIDIGSPRAASDLRKIFAKAIVTREEGLVLKPDDPFIDLDRSGSLYGSPIKFKKEYIGNFGDVGDFAVVGARYDPDKAKGYRRIPGLKWTHFYLGCASSKNELYTVGATPEFTIVAIVDLNETMLRTVVQAQPRTVPAKDSDAFRLTIPPGLAQGKRPTVVFTTPLVFDILCFSFDKEGNVGFLTPRFPVVSKVHFDRDYRDTITFPELQELAEKATAERGWEERDSQEMLGWVAALEGADPGGRAVDCVSQETVSSGLTPSIEFSEDVPKEVSAVSSISSAASSPMSSRSGVTLTPPTSLPGEPSSEAEDGDKPDSPCVKKRKSVRKDREHVHVGSPLKRRDSRVEGSGSSRWSRGVPSEFVGAVERDAADGTYGALNYGSGLNGASSQPLLGSSPPPDVYATTRARSPESTSTAPDPSNTHPQLESLNPCPLRGPNCPFHNRSLLLPPTLTTKKDVRRALRQHGIISYITDNAAWRPEDVHRPDTWKICFVDVDDEVGTRVFLAGLEGRPLRRVGGREYVEVYDWRVLLGVGDLEREGGGGMRKGRDPFRRWFVGLV